MLSQNFHLSRLGAGLPFVRPTPTTCKRAERLTPDIALLTPAPPPTMRSNTIPYFSPRVFLLFIFSIVFNGHLISASPVPLPGNSNTESPFLRLPNVNKGSAKASYPPTTASVSNPAQECTLIESAPHHPMNIDPATRRLGYYGVVPEPDPRRYIPTYSKDPTLAPDFPVGVRQKRKFPCQHQITFTDREDEKRPAATGILCSMPNPTRPGAPQRDFHTNMMLKIIRNVHLELDDRDNVHIPLRIKWEIDMLHKTQKLGSSLLPQWQYYVDPQSIKSAVTPGGMRSAVGEVYITIAPEDGAILRELRDYQDLKTPQDRKRFLDHIKFLVVHKIITYAVTYGVFHGYVVEISLRTRP